ncbi:MAG TPA: YoaK family protein [Puia sp.]|nr:YoaK family protein [Puia sp.]
MTKDRVGALSLLLTFIAGYTDVTTFVAADKLFSAHITGNFIVLAYDLIRGADRSAYMKLLAFPVFVIAAMAAAWYDRAGGRPGRLLRLEGALLLLAAGLSGPLHSNFAAAMLIVAAMAVQNAFWRLYPALSWGMTTVMTGNVTTATVSFVQGFWARPRNTEKLTQSRRILAMAGLFLSGCLCGGFLAARFGLVVVAGPGIIVLLASRLTGPAHSLKKP